MSNIDIEFSRALLHRTLLDVKAVLPNVNLRKVGWTYRFGDANSDSYEFQITNPPQGVQSFYWSGSASNAYEARSKGWDAYLSKFHAEAFDTNGDLINRECSFYRCRIIHAFGSDYCQYHLDCKAHAKLSNQTENPTNQ